MSPKAILLVSLPLVLAACTDAGQLENPFHKPAPFVATAVPADFAIQVDENHDTYYSRQHITQKVASAGAMSTTTYTTYRDYNNTVSNQFSQETPLSPTQLQNMWNDVSRYNLLHRSTVWVNWLSGADLFKHDAYTIQIRANGQTRTYRQTNGFSGPVRPLVHQLEDVRLPITQDSKTPVIAPPSPATVPPSPTTLPLTPAAPSTPETKPASTPTIVPTLLPSEQSPQDGFQPSDLPRVGSTVGQRR